MLSEDDGADVRYRMLETLRQFGQARLSKPQSEAVNRRHRDYFLNMARKCAEDWTGPRQVEWVDRLRQEHANLRAALQFSVESEAGSAALHLVSDLEGYWIVTGMVSEARRWLDLALRLPAGPAENAVAVRMAAWFALTQVDLPMAQQMVDRLRSLAEESADEGVKAQALFGEGLLAAWEDNAERGICLIELSLAIFDRRQDRTHQAFAYVAGGMVLGFTGQLERAVASQRACLSLTEPLGELYMSSYAFAMLGMLALAGGDLGNATSHEKKSLLMKRKLGDQLGIALVLEFMAWIAVAEKRYERAALLWGRTGKLWRSIGTVLESMPFFSEVRAENERVARGELTDSTFELLMTKGAAMSPSESVDFALEETTTGSAVPGNGRTSPLTPREQEVASLVSEGLTNQEIADRLVISIRTAEGHVENILRRLGFRSRSSIATWVAQHDVDQDS